MQKLIILFSIIFLSCSSQQVSIIGKWKPIRVSYKNHFGKSPTIIYDSEKTDSIKKAAFQIYLAEYISDSALVQIDTIALKIKLDENFKNYKLANLELNKDRTFFMESFGLILPTVEPGWHFGDSIGGKWSSDSVSLKLTTGDKKISRSFFYKISLLTHEKLIIKQTSEHETEPFNEIIFVRQ